MKKILIAVTLILLLLTITNPSIKRFKDFVGSNSYRGLRRTNNLILFSYYTNNEEKKYLGVLFNFFDVTKQSVKKQYDSYLPDTTSSNIDINKRMSDSEFNKEFDKAVKKTGIK